MAESHHPESPVANSPQDQRMLEMMQKKREDIQRRNSFAVDLKKKLPNYETISVKELIDLSQTCEDHPKKDRFIKALTHYQKQEQNSADDELICDKLKSGQLLEAVVMKCVNDQEEIKIEVFGEYLVKNVVSGLLADYCFVPDGKEFTVQLCEEASFHAHAGMIDHGMDLIRLEEDIDGETSTIPPEEGVRRRLDYIENNMKNYQGAILALYIPEDVKIHPSIFAIETNGKPLSIITNQTFPGINLDRMFKDDNNLKKRWKHVHLACGTGLEYMKKWLEVLEGEVWNEKSFLQLTVDIEAELKRSDNNFQYCHKISDNDLTGGTYCTHLHLAYEGHRRRYLPKRELLIEYILPLYAFLAQDLERVTIDFIERMITKQNFNFYGTLGIKGLRIWMYCYEDIHKKIDYMSKDCLVIFYEKDEDYVHGIFTAIDLSGSEIEKMEIFRKCTPKISNLEEKLKNRHWKDSRRIIEDLEESDVNVEAPHHRGSETHYSFTFMPYGRIKEKCKKLESWIEPNEFGRTIPMRLFCYYTNEKLPNQSNVCMNPNLEQKNIIRLAELFHKHTNTQEEVTDREVHLGNNNTLKSIADFKENKFLQIFVNELASDILMKDPPHQQQEIQQISPSSPEEPATGGGSQPKAPSTRTEPVNSGESGKKPRAGCVIL